MSDQQTVSGAVEQATAADAEIAAITAAYYALKDLDSQARYRVINWLNQRLNSEQNDHDEEPF